MRFEIWRDDSLKNLRGTPLEIWGLDFLKNLICTPCFFGKDSRPDHTTAGQITPHFAQWFREKCMGKIWCDLRAWLFQKKHPRRSHQILSSEFGKNAWAKSGVMCALLVQKRPVCRSHQILSKDFGKHAWAKSGLRNTCL